MPEILKVDFPTAAPGSCKLCGSADKEWFIDMGHSEEFHGAIYYCSECMAHIATVCGFGAPVVVEKLEKVIVELENDNFDLKAKSEGLEQALDGILRARFVDGPDPRDYVSAVTPNVPEEGPEGISEGEIRVDVGTGNVDESSDDEDVAGLRPSSESSSDGGFDLFSN